MDCWNILFGVDAKGQALFRVVFNTVLSQAQVHIEWLSQSLPGVGRSVEVLLEVPVQNLVHRFL